MHKVIIVHRWGGTPENDWYSWLKNKLEKKGYDVVVPAMPNTNEPDITVWVNHLREVAGKPNQQTHFVGHSIGCQTIMRYLETVPQGTSVGYVVFVAGWMKLQNLEDAKVERIAKSWTETQIDFDKVKEKVKQVLVFLSDNDPYNSVYENKMVFEQKLAAKVIVAHNKGHFTAADGVTELPNVLSFITQGLKRKKN